MFEGSQGARSRIICSPRQFQSSQNGTQNSCCKERRTEEVSGRNNIPAEEEGEHWEKGEVVAGQHWGLFVCRKLKELTHWIQRTPWMTDSTSCRSPMPMWRGSEWSLLGMFSVSHCSTQAAGHSERNGRCEGRES